MKHQFNFTIKFMFFGNNYPRDFIKKAWANDTHIADHLESKFSTMYQRHGTMTFFKWYMELSDNNRHILMNWINLNYNHQ